MPYNTNPYEPDNPLHTTWRAGRDANIHGRPRTECPYDCARQSVAAAAWIDGWTTADVQQRDEACTSV
jgi:ribosome modulation factor